MPSPEFVYKACTEILGGDIFDNFKNNCPVRLLVQKTMYVIQESIGRDLYVYSWYLAGPYSPTITQIVYNSILPDLEKESDEWSNLELTESGEKTVEKAKAYLCYENDIESLDKPGFFELMASMLYLSRYGNQLNEVEAKLMQTKCPKFSEETIKALVSKYWGRLEVFIGKND